MSLKALLTEICLCLLCSLQILNWLLSFWLFCLIKLERWVFLFFQSCIFELYVKDDACQKRNEYCIGPNKDAEQCVEAVFSGFKRHCSQVESKTDAYVQVHLLVEPNLAWPKEFSLLVLCKNVRSACRYKCSDDYNDDQLNKCEEHIGVKQRASILNEKLRLVPYELSLGAPSSVIKVE